ncbi:hypothetical protein HPB49_022031 [Dermacentor silvarum]|uniref:Uncharacterized protein n=1 Tax=Dermacentor silvarum TaxID=543639 RepID=A0ACB8CTF7_DERSI|nr:hypothetical protein HPB49_022031 [Dermacentor silvarum]
MALHFGLLLLALSLSLVTLFPYLSTNASQPSFVHAAMLYPEFQYRPPPPSYQASMQEYRLRLLLLDRQGGPPTLPTPVALAAHHHHHHHHHAVPAPPPVVPPPAAVTSQPAPMLSPVSPPPTYRSGLHARRSLKVPSAVCFATAGKRGRGFCGALCNPSLWWGKLFSTAAFLILPVCERNADRQPRVVPYETGSGTAPRTTFAERDAAWSDRVPASLQVRSLRRQQRMTV